MKSRALCGMLLGCITAAALANPYYAGNPCSPYLPGSVTIASNNCNDLTFEFDCSGIGLGEGARRLQRLYALETAGHDCRDYEARVAANR
jgi:hypothetical protein